MKQSISLIKIKDALIEHDYPIAIVLFVLAVLCSWAWWKWHSLSQSSDHYYQIWLTFLGLVFDVVFILVLFSFVQSLRHKRNQELATAREQRDIIEDYKAWDSEEARHRLAGAMRRLNKLGETEFDLKRLRLSSFEFRNNEIESLRRSKFYDGKSKFSHDGKRNVDTKAGDTSVILTKVNFDHVDCRDVVFSPNEPTRRYTGSLKDSGYRHCQIVDCTFRNTELNNAIFNGAYIKWTEAPPLTAYKPIRGGKKVVDSSHSGYSPPFSDADFKEAKFKQCIFENPDFRGVRNLLDADFTGAHIFGTVLFDSKQVQSDFVKKAKARVRGEMNSGDVNFNPYPEIII